MSPPGRPTKRRTVFNLPVEENLAALLLVAMTTIAFVGTVSRYVFNRGIPFLEQFTPELFVWMTFLGAAAAAQRRAHLGSTFLLEQLPPKLRRALRLVLLGLSVVFFGILVYYGWQGVQNDLRFGMKNALGLPNWVITVAVPIGGLLLIARSVQAFLTEPAAEPTAEPVAEPPAE